MRPESTTHSLADNLAELSPGIELRGAVVVLAATAPHAKVSNPVRPLHAVYEVLDEVHLVTCVYYLWVGTDYGLYEERHTVTLHPHWRFDRVQLIKYKTMLKW